MRTLAAYEMSCWLCEIADGALWPIADIKIPPPHDWVKVRDGFAAIVQNESKIFWIDEKNGQANTSIAALPSTVHPRSIAAWNEWIFVCGHSSSETPDNPRTLPEDAFLLRSSDPWRVPVLVAYRSGLAGSKWTSIFPALLPGRKEFDALFVHDRRLIALDNVVMPKYLVVFELDTNAVGKPTFIELPAHGTYESIVSAALGTGHLAILSSTVGEGGSGRHVSIVDLKTLKERALIGAFEPMFSDARLTESKNAEMSQMLFDATSIAVLGDIIVLACGDKGLAAASISETIAASDNTEVEVDEVMVIDFSEDGEAKTSYVDSYRAPVVSHTLRVLSPAEIIDRTVISVRTIEGADAVVLTCRDRNGVYQPVLIQRCRLLAGLGGAALV